MKYEVKIEYWDDEDGDGEVTVEVDAQNEEEAENKGLDKASQDTCWEEVRDTTVKKLG
jgi:hypothetical protein